MLMCRSDPLSEVRSLWCRDRRSQHAPSCPTCSRYTYDKRPCWRDGTRDARSARFTFGRRSDYASNGSANSRSAALDVSGQGLTANAERYRAAEGGKNFLDMCRERISMGVLLDQPLE